MFSSKSAYGAIKEVENVGPAPVCASSRARPPCGWKINVALTCTVAATLVGLAAIAILAKDRDEHSSPLAWQDQQPVAGETLTAFSRELTFPEERTSADGELRTTLRIAATTKRSGPLAPALNVRAYEGSVPGPTLRVKPGDRLVINLANDLRAPEGNPRADEGGSDALEGKIEAWPNVTNIHVHGMHVSPADIADNIYRRAGPGDVLEYVYDVPDDHYPGTFYYHPHFEGSSSVQTLGGMAGAIVVEDPAGSLPPELDAMREVVVVIQETNIESGTLRNYKAASEIGGSKMPLFGNGGESNADEGGSKEVELLHFVTLNGQYQPWLQMQPGEAVRVRLVHGGNNDHMYVSLRPASREGRAIEDSKVDDPAEGQSGHRRLKTPAGEGKVDGYGACTMLELARDGVYLAAPRSRRELMLAPGSRADVVFSCAQPGVYRLASSKGQGDAQELPLAYLGKDTDVFSGTLAFLDVSGHVVDMKLPEESPRPVGGASRLLQDLRDVPSSEVAQFVFEFNSGDKVTHLNQSYTWYGVNGAQYNRSVVSRTVTLDAVEEWVIVNQRVGRGEGAQRCETLRSGEGGSSDEARRGGAGRRLQKRHALRSAEEGDETVRDGKESIAACRRAGPGKATGDGHPFHLHVNHFQVVNSSWGEEGPDWNVGDWRDTIAIPTPGNVTIRWRADDFTGKAVAHCHIFGHSDTGMVLNFEVVEY